MEKDYSDTCVLVTGASVGIGRETAKRFAARGARVAIVARRAELLDSLANEIVDDGGSSPLTITADLAAPESAPAVREAIDAEFARLDVLVNNAGGADRPGVALTDEVWTERFDINFHAKRRLTAALEPLLFDSPRGRVINLAGILEPQVVSASQAAVAACILWSKAYSRSVAARGMTVNCVAPGRVESEQIAKLFPDADSRAQFIEKDIPAGAFGAPEDVAELIVFLASEGAGYITGQVIAVDGGMSRSV
ncbi:3-oxoacyl-[acyl-carrier protein] reductase [Microbacterium sp. cf046]|uniref:SDR family NAD(P)-dependent oxidoreductase n=1 Tax=Microbacterium sp. cf046 TaxID=1761803 RepID=UPI0008E1B7C3|nr:SDR family oxidoreductase [Microbacterium sp. cf046]SFS16762.1 3-oxoacyl-[acyl-carrier protein] reductase [Microbacterium sp. cf046]